METVAVVGALGAQGSSVIRALRSSSATSQWKIRALTSSPDSDSARALGDQGNITIVFCDINDPETIRRAFKGCTLIFANTVFSASTLMIKGQSGAEKLEHDHGMNLVRAAAKTDGLKHLVWSTLPDCSRISRGGWKIPHFMCKQGANAYIVGDSTGYDVKRQQEEPGWGSLRNRSTLMPIGLYGSNFRNHLYRPTKKPDSDNYVVQLPCPPDVPFSLAGDETQNVGIVVRAIFESPEKSMGKWIAWEAERISCRQWVAFLMMAAQSQGVKESVTFEECTMQSMEDKWGILGTEIGQMMEYIGDVKERAFENTTSLPEISAGELGIESGLVSARSFYEHLDCVALFREVIDGELHMGTASR